MKRSTLLILGLFSTAPAHAAAANVVAFTCDYELGTDANAKRMRIGSVAVAIDVNVKSAWIDFGSGWFRTNTLQIDGPRVKEKAPPKSGKDLGFFYFDLKKNSGGFSGSGSPEFFDACVRTKNAPVIPNDVQASATKSNNKKPPRKLAAVPEKPSPPRAMGRATTDYYGNTKSRTKPAWAAEAAMNPNYKKQETRRTTAPAAVSEAAPPPTGGKATTEYYGSAKSQTKPAWAVEAAMNPNYKKEETRPATTTAAPSEAAPSPTGGKATTEDFGDTASPSKPAWTAEATMNPAYESVPAAATSQPNSAIEACSRALSTAAQAANLSFANASFAIYPGDKPALRKIAKIVNDCGNVAVEVGGHTDSLGDPADNKTLSQLRANAVVDFLVREGVDSSKLKAVGYGQDKPIATNKTREGRRLNRRVEFRVSGR